MDGPNDPLCPLGKLFYSQSKKLSKHRQQQKDELFLKLYITHKIFVRD